MTRARPTPKCELRPVWTQRTVRDEVALDLPVPPSVNALYRNAPGIGRVKTRAYRAWMAEAVLMGSVQRPGRIVGRADVVLRLPPFRGDADNRIKAALDAAKAIGVIADDGTKYIRHVTVWQGDEAGETARLIFTRVTDDAAEMPEAA